MQMGRILNQETTRWPFVKSAVAYDAVDSTSDRAAVLVRGRHCTLPLVVWARTQTQGRGRGTHEWWSDAGSLTLTVAIDPLSHGVSVEFEPRLALATAVAVIEALDELELGNPSLGIRWPNDLEAGGRKLGGILPERLEIPQGHRILVGIGLNVHTNLAAAPAEVRAMATSLAALHGKPLDEATVERLIPAILAHFESVLRRLALGDPTLSLQWGRLDQLREKWVRVDFGTHRVAGWGKGIDHQGALCLDDGNEPIRIFGGQVLRDHS
jgi:BirA family transcriptional regulator, biotin operon repressor / biotin---[acetyl-CoA-carboxylase] ligase